MIVFATPQKLAFAIAFMDTPDLYSMVTLVRLNKIIVPKFLRNTDIFAAPNNRIGARRFKQCAKRLACTPALIAIGLRNEFPINVKRIFTHEALFVHSIRSDWYNGPSTHAKSRV